MGTPSPAHHDPLLLRPPQGADRQLSAEATMAHALQEHALLEKIRTLPPAKLTEVEDFVDFLRQRDLDQRLAEAVTKMGEDSFHAVWDNDDDADYDEL